MAKSIEELRIEYLGGVSAPSVLYNGEGMENVIHVRVNVGVRKQTVEPLPVKIFSQDIHNVLFLITFNSADGTARQPRKYDTNAFNGRRLDHVRIFIRHVDHAQD